MKLAVMQPYFFPYIGYFQLIKSVDRFIFYDDVNFIKNGWINRNRILINGKPSYLTVTLNGASPFMQIKDVLFSDNRSKLLKTLENTYKRAPYYEEAINAIKPVFLLETKHISELAIESIKAVSNYVRLNVDFEQSSKLYGDSKKLDKSERLKQICHQNKASSYHNPIGGTDLYFKDDFKKSNIDLKFLQTDNITYKQFKNDFIPNLSIIDIMMFNSKEQINELLKKYKLI